MRKVYNPDRTNYAMTHREIARVMGVSNTLIVRIERRAITKLRANQGFQELLRRMVEFQNRERVLPPRNDTWKLGPLWRDDVGLACGGVFPFRPARKKKGIDDDRKHGGGDIAVLRPVLSGGLDSCQGWGEA